MQRERLLSSQPVFEGKIVRLRVDTVALPSGRQTSREVIDHDAVVAIVAVDGDENAVLVRQHRYPVGKDLLEVPAGILEESESPDDCAQRELQEETGYMSRDLRPLGGFWVSPGFCNEYIHVYVARDLAPSKLPADDDEYIRVERLPLSRIPDLIREGVMQDAKSIAALLMVTCL